MSRFRVVLAEDSDIAASFIERLIEQDSEIRVVGRARNGAELLGLPQLEMAQVAIVDVLMPGIAGLSLVRRLSEQCAVIVVSSMEPDSPVAKEALALGARAFFCKRGLREPAEAERLREAIRGGLPSKPVQNLGPVVFIVGSTGAVAPLEGLVRDIEPLQLPVLVVQHLPEGKAEGLAQLLCCRGARARVARSGERLEPTVFIAPIGRHMQLDASQRIRLLDGPAVSQHCPSGDVLLESAVRLGSRAIAVILSGLGRDGARGIKALADGGAKCFVQRPEECAAAYMPRAALAASQLVQAVSTRWLGPAIQRAAKGG